MLSIFWLNPQQVQKYFTQAPSTVDQVQACAKDFCQEHTQTMFVAIQSGLHPLSKWYQSGNIYYPNSVVP